MASHSRHYLHPDEYVHLAPEFVGSEVRAHHCKTGRGHDKLYIKRTPDDTIVAYCHHCHKKGVYYKPSTSLSSLKSRLIKTKGVALSSSSTTEDIGCSVNLPPDSLHSMTLWPQGVVDWVRKYDIGLGEITNNNLAYSASLGGLIIPSFVRGKETGFVRSYQVRLFDQPRGPKYMTIRASGILPPDLDNWEYRMLSIRPKSFIPFRSGKTRPPISGDSSTLVIVEDAISAIKAARTHFALALCGCDLSSDTAALNIIADTFENVIVALDNDNEIVKQEQRQLREKLTLIMRGRVKVLKLSQDPKEYSKDELEHLLTWGYA